MSREHLYKAKRVNWRELPKEEWWVEGYLTQRKGSDGRVFESWIILDSYEQLGVLNMKSALVSEIGFNCYKVDSETVCEYTGLTDRDGRKIFEWDIVGRYSECREEWYYGVVKYGEFNCSCCSGIYGWYFDDEDIRDCNMYEVRGNIFDNLELLE